MKNSINEDKLNIISTIAAAIASIAAVIAIYQTYNISKLQYEMEKSYFGLNSISISVIKDGTYSTTFKFVNIGKHTAEQVEWACFPFINLSQTNYLNTWKNSIANGIVPNDTLIINFTEIDYSEILKLKGDKYIYLPIAISYYDKILDERYDQFFYPKIEYRPLLNNWKIVHTNNREIKSHYKVINEILKEGLNRTIKLN